jgi:competence protein ComEA
MVTRPGRPGRRSSAHEEAVARRLELLGAELAGFRLDGRSLDPHVSTHTRVRQVREPTVDPVVDPVVGAVPDPVPPPAAVPAPGRHAARGRLTLGPAQLAVVAILVLAALGAGAWWLLGGRSSEVTVPVAPRSAAGLVSLGATPSASGSGAGTVTVDVAGEVRRPGIAVLDAGARVVDALKAAGGPRGDVDLTALNLARVLVDGEQILVGIDPPAGVAAGVTGTSAPVATLVNINTADQVGLESLPDVGPVTAQAILTYRSEHGAFTSVDQLLDVDGIGEATLAQLTPYVTL